MGPDLAHDTKYACFYGSVALNAGRNEFPILYAEYVPSGPIQHPLFLRRYQYPPDTVTTLFGKGCGGVISGTRPLQGHQFFRVVLSKATPKTAAILLLSTGPGGLPLDPLGMTGCALNLSPAYLVGFSLVADTQGKPEMTFPLDEGLPPADLHFLYFHLPPQAHPYNLLATKGMTAKTR